MRANKGLPRPICSFHMGRKECVVDRTELFTTSNFIESLKDAALLF